MMKRVLVVALPALLAVSCGDDDGGSKPDSGLDAPADVAKTDMAMPDLPGTPDLPMKLDLPPATIDGPPAMIDGTPEIDGAPVEMDGAEGIDGPAGSIDGADEGDAPMPIDGGTTAVDGGMIDA